MGLEKKRCTCVADGQKVVVTETDVFCFICKGKIKIEKEVKKMEDKKIRVWWNSQFGNAAFHVKVKDLEEAKLILRTLTSYDIYLGDKIIANAGGLEEYDISTGWEEWFTEDGKDINKILEEEDEE